MKNTHDLRVLIIGPYPPPFGGIASHLTSLVPGLKANGWEDVAIVSFGAANMIEKTDELTVYRYNVKKNAHHLLYPSNWRFFFTALICFSNAKLGFSGLVREATKTMLSCRIADKHRSSTVSVYQADLSLMLIPCAKIWAGTKNIILTVFGEIYDNYEFIKQRTHVFDKLLSIPNHVIASSQHCASSFNKLGIKRKITPVYYGIELGRFKGANEKRSQFRANLQVSDNEILVLFMGRFTEDMGLHSVLDVVTDILDSDKKPAKPIKFLLAGAKGPISGRAQQMADKYPGFIHIMNDVPFSIQPAMYAGSDIVLAPTRDQHACMGMSIKEAMATGRSVIASISGGIPEAIIHEVNGILIPLGKNNSIEHDTFRDSIIDLAANETKREQFGAEGLKRAETVFSSKTTIEKINRLFSSPDAIL